MKASPLLAARVFDTPLLIAKHKLEAILHVLGPRWGFDVQGSKPKPKAFDDYEDDDAPPREYCAYEVKNGVARIPIFGTLIHRATGMQAESGFVDYLAIGNKLDLALSDSQVNAILLEFDSGGGEVNGCYDLADRIFAARQVKPVWAHSVDWADSAAYLLASAAERVLVTQTGEVGSIGVVMTHVDQSKQNQMMGIAVTYLFAGERKVDGWPDIPLSNDARQRFQGEVDKLYSMFTSKVAAFREIDERAVIATQALTYVGDDAVSIGLADAVQTIDETLDELAELSRPQSDVSPGLSVYAMELGNMNTNPKAAAAPVATETANVQQMVADAAASGLATGKAEGAKAASERIKTILGSEEAKGREAQAQAIAFETDMSAEAAVKVLAAGPKATATPPAPAPVNLLDKAMQDVKNPKVGADAGATDEDSVEKIAANAVAAYLGTSADAPKH